MSPDTVQEEQYDLYRILSDDQLRERLSEEFDRAKAMDEKTFKMTLAITIALTILGSTATFLVDGVPLENWRPLVAGLAALAIIYSFCGGFVALGALRTLPTFGYGTDFIIRAKNNSTLLARALGSQEQMNTIRHLRNETGYQCLRNGFLSLFAALMLYATSIVIVTTTLTPPSPAATHQHSATGLLIPRCHADLVASTDCPALGTSPSTLGGKRTKP